MKTVVQNLKKNTSYLDVLRVKVYPRSQRTVPKNSKVFVCGLWLQKKILASAIEIQTENWGNHAFFRQKKSICCYVCYEKKVTCIFWKNYYNNSIN